jgi:hypothetical protein
MEEGEEGRRGLVEEGDGAPDRDGFGVAFCGEGGRVSVGVGGRGGKKLT